MIYIDCETDNPVAWAEPDPVTDRIVSIALYEPDGLVPMKYRTINPGYDALTRSSIHGITAERISGQLRFSDVARSLHAIVDEHETIVTYNGNRYDIPLLYEEFARSRINWDPTRHQFIDLLAVWRDMEPRNLDSAVLRFIGRVHVDAHTAEGDVNVLPDVLEGMRKEWGCWPVDGADPLIEASVRTVKIGDKDLPLADLNGMLARDEAGQLLYATKRNRGVAVPADPGYARWLLSQAFIGAHTRRLLTEKLEEGKAK